MTTQAPILYCDILEQTHTLIAGQTGSGKSVMLQGIITTALKQGNNSFIFIDPKRVELRDYKVLPNCIAYANTAEEAVTALDKGLAIMEQRYITAERQGLKKSTEQPIYIIIDELADLLISKEGKQIKTQLERLTALARASNIKVIACTQKPSRKMLPAELSLNFTAKVGLKCQTSIESKQIIGVSGCEHLPMYGECLYLRPGYDLEHWRVRLTDESETQEWIDYTIGEQRQVSKVISLFRKVI